MELYQKVDWKFSKFLLYNLEKVSGYDKISKAYTNKFRMLVEKFIWIKVYMYIIDEFIYPNMQN